MIDWYDTFRTGATLHVLTGVVALLTLSWTGSVLFFSGFFQRKIEESWFIDWICLFSVISLAWSFWIYSLSFGASLKEWPTFQKEVSRSVALDLRILLQEETETEPVSAIDDPLRGGFIGGFDFMGLTLMSPVLGDDGPLFPAHRLYPELPHPIFMVFQGLIFLALITPLLVLLQPEMHWEGQSLFAVVWGSLVYAPIAHWDWGDGWLATQGLLDSSGGMLYLAIGSSALGIALTRSRRGFTEATHVPVGDDSAQTLRLGTGLFLYWCGALWLSGVLTYEYGGKAAIALVNCQLSAAAAVMTSIGAGRFLKRGDDIFNGFTGGMAGLVIIAAGSSLVLPRTAIIFGIIAGVMSQIASMVRATTNRQPRAEMRLVLVWGVPGLLGLFLTGVFATSSIAEHDRFGKPIEGAIGGNMHQLVVQTTAIGSTILYASVVSAVVYLMVGWMCRRLNLIRETVSA